uniref:CCHC-type domain-containing protein n=1 Tax=Cannabis sativa TaxID=3483 RepID=A0A803PIB2_CANSA
MVDDVTKGRGKLRFLRVLIEVSIQQEFPNIIHFEDEFGSNVSIAITYEWKPIICSHCKGMGHFASDCRKKEGKQQEWVIKKDNRKTEETETGKQVVDEFQDERIGVRARHTSSCDFLNCVNNFQLEDVKYSGNYFTWSNKHQASDKIISKLDRVLANPAWIDNFQTVEALFLNEGIFDNTLVVLTAHPDYPSCRKPFKYVKMWATHPLYHQQVSKVWQGEVKGTKMFQIVAKLKALKPVFKELNQLGFSEIHIIETQAQVKLNECPDGYNSLFFQDSWDLVGNEVSEAILSFLHTEVILKASILCCRVKTVFNLLWSLAKEGIPFKYLGMPICVKRISSSNCRVLVEKMTGKIKGLFRRIYRAKESKFKEVSAASITTLVYYI